SNKQQELVTKSEETELPFSPVILGPESPDVLSSKTVTLSITEDIPIKDVLIELSRLADLELALDPNITGGIILKVKDRPINDVIEMVVDQASLRYSVENGVLRVQKDGPYLINYTVDYINLNRSSKGSMTTQTQVLSVDLTGSNSAGGGSGGSSGGANGENQGLNSGSSNEITTSYDGDLWKSIEENLSRILYGHEQALIKTANEEIKPTLYFTVNRQAGLIGVMADSKKQKAIKKYLDQVKLTLSAQVLIEAKIIEVQLNQAYSAGIDWKNASGDNLLANFLYAPTITKDSIFQGIVKSDIQMGNKLQHMLRFIEGFGTTRILPNPRISALNNQVAVLTFATNKPYFTVSGSIQQQAANATGLVINQPLSISSTLKTVPIGIILSMQPSINLDTKEIAMNFAQAYQAPIQQMI
ncbi:hypothetical protein RFI_39215, partial [Reticulomyxa filosa]